MIEIEGKSVTYSVKIDDESFWHRFSGGWSNDVTRTGDSWYHLRMNRHRFEYGSAKENFNEEDRAALLALETDYYHFHWYYPKPDERRKKTYAKRLKKFQEEAKRFHGGH